MKLILLAAVAAAALATPAMAQTSGSTGTSSPTSNGGQPSANTSGPTTPADTSMSMPSSDTSMAQPAPASSMPMAASDGTDPVGGYQPAGPATAGPVPAGARVVFQPSQTPDQAYPAPAPLARYPVCKKGQFDNCMNGPNSTHSREVRGRR